MTKQPPDRKLDYVAQVTQGEGYASWQTRDKRGESELERAFRARIECRKERLLAAAIRVRHPALLTDQEVEQAERNIRKTACAREWFEKLERDADYVASRPDGYVADMLPELTPWVGYTFFCPNCYGVKSFEGAEYTIIDWNCRRPDRLRCKCCGQVYPSEKYPETGALQCPRSGQTLTFYLNDEERRHPQDRSGKLAWRWAGHPVHPCFSGVIRERKISFMIGSARTLALVYRFTGKERYAERAKQVLLRLAHCFRHTWLYHDYWDAVADCDALFAAWHDRNLLLEWKRVLFSDAYARDSLDCASMIQSYWGAGRIHPSTDVISLLPTVCEAYDLIFDARGTDGKPLWTPELRARVEKDLILEWLIEAEPFLGGPGKAKTTNNKAPRGYRAMASVAKCLGIPDFAEVAIRGYEAIRDASFACDGFSRETPSYTDMYLGELLQVPELLHRFRWPKGRTRRKGVVDLYRTDPLLRLMLRTRLESLRPDGRLLPHGDSHQSPVRQEHGFAVLETGLKRFPELYAKRLPVLYRVRQSKPTEYGILRLDLAGSGLLKPTRSDDLGLPEAFFPGWMMAVLRHGQGPKSTVFTMGMSPAGGHRHYDNLAIYYETGGRTILGDHGYLAEAPAQRWVKDTFSHNLVIVDDQRQVFRSDGLRKPSLRMMATSPLASVVEGASQVYAQCSDYRRLAVLVKGPAAETFVVDIFRVQGGEKHDYRLFSEVAASDAGKAARLDFPGLEMPPEPPLPEIGASERPEDIYGLRDVREVRNPPPSWQAVWHERGCRHRMWMLSRVGACQASNGPGQEMWTDVRQVGRRVRYLDAVNTGKNLKSTFVAIHEPCVGRGSMPIRKAERLEVPRSAGANAVAVRIESEWGVYVILSEFARTAVVAGVRFQGKFGIFHTTPAGKRRLLACGAQTLMSGGIGFQDAPALWTGAVERQTEKALCAATERPRAWPPFPEGVTSYLLTGSGEQYTGFPVKATRQKSIAVARFPLQPARRFLLLATQYVVE
jgi:hypothetical protein